VPLLLESLEGDDQSGRASVTVIRHSARVSRGQAHWLAGTITPEPQASSIGNRPHAFVAWCFGVRRGEANTALISSLTTEVPGTAPTCERYHGTDSSKVSGLLYQGL